MDRRAPRAARLSTRLVSRGLLRDNGSKRTNTSGLVPVAPKKRTHWSSVLDKMPGMGCCGGRGATGVGTADDIAGGVEAGPADGIAGGVEAGPAASAPVPGLTRGATR